ncbi:sugar translocase [Methylobacterium sp. Leaf456]|uniref:GtrA family protein n=1 Tax=Methylobacterium sp. Leaf456 TaxID=1736382 RepID=UPI0006FF55EB|nr:GtrA family protein [Methylobacterium sp. Leaf456]KQT49250.1 sugar translocase [Methylobacterium sp. Leaf456]
MRAADSEVIRFLIAGGSAAAINWGARILLSLALPFEAALIVAYAVGMAAGFWLYRRFVFRGAGAGSVRGQLPLFLAVNMVGMGVVLAVSAGFVAALGVLLPGLSLPVAEALSHGVGIAVGAVANYFGHRLLTFSAQPQTL